MVEYPGIEPGMSKTADLQSTASPLMLLLHLCLKFLKNNVNFLTSIYCITTLATSQELFKKCLLWDYNKLVWQ